LRYENNNELIVFWSNGITKKSFVNVIIIFSLFFSVIQILFTTYFVPISQNKARSYIRSSNIDFFPSLLKEKKFIDTVSNLTIFIEKKNKNGSMEKIFLRENIDKDTSQTIYAKEGKLVNQNKKTYIKLFDGEIINIKNKKINTFGFSETEIDLSKYKTKTTTYPKIQELSTMTLLNCISFDSIKLFLSSMKSKYNCKNNNTKIFFQEFFKRLYLPLYIPLVALVSSIMILYSKDNFRFNKFKNIIFSTGLFLIIVSEITVRYFGTNIDYNVILLFIPLIIFILIYSSIFMFGNNYLKK